MIDKREVGERGRREAEDGKWKEIFDAPSYVQGLRGLAHWLIDC
jgi:hypothetical protein